MRKAVCIIYLLLFIVSCNKKEVFHGPDYYADGFENYTIWDDMFLPDETAWTHFANTADGNYFEIDTANPHSGNKCMKFFGNKSTDDNVSKCSIAKQQMAFWENDIVFMSAWYYLEGNGNTDWMFLFDIEEQTAIGAGPGMRIAMEDNSLLVEHKYNKPNIYQEETNKIDFPRNTWVHVEAEIKLSRKKKGYIKVWQDGQQIISRDNWQTLPKDILYIIQGTRGMYTSIEFGITANTKFSDVVLYVDDVYVKKIN